MWRPARVVTPPSAEFVTIEMARAQCGIRPSDTSRDEELERLIAAATASVESYCGIKIAEQAIDAECDSFGDFDRIAAAPLSSIVSISYTDISGGAQVVPSADYIVRRDGMIGRVEPAFGRAWPTILPQSRIVMRAIVGFAEPEPVLVSAMLLVIGRHARMSGTSAGLRRAVVEGIGSRDYDTSGAFDTGVDAAFSAMLEHYRNWPLA